MVGWNAFAIGNTLRSPPIADGSNIAAVSRIKGHMEVFWVAPNGSVQDAFFYDNQSPNWKWFELAPAGSAKVSAGIAAISRKAGHMEVWWVGTAGSIEGAYFYENQPWRRYQLAPNGSAALTSAIFAQSRLPTHMNVWWIGTAGSIEACYWVEGTQVLTAVPWTRYQIAGDGSAALKSAMTGVARIPSSEETWWQSAQGSVEAAYWYEGLGPWRRYQIAPAGSAAIGAGMDVRSRYPSMMNLNWIHPDGSIQGKYFIAGVKPWTPYAIAGQGSAAIEGGITGVSRQPNTEEIWWITPDGRVKDAYWYEGMGPWNLFDLTPPMAARANSQLDSVARIKGSMELWYASPQGNLADSFWYDVPHFDFFIDVIQCNITRSRNNDTLHMAISLAIGSRDPIKISKSLGQHAEGFIYPELAIRDIPVADNDVVVFSYVIVNNGHGDDGVVRKALESAAGQIAHTGASAAANAVGAAAGAASGAAIGALIGTSVPIIGTIIGAGLGALTGALLSSVVDIISPNCDGAIGAAAKTISGSELRGKLESGQKYGHQDSNPGIDSPAGCGRNSEYLTTWSVKRTPE